MRVINTIIRKELLSFFRDKNTVINSIILPIALYPLLFWGMNQIFLLQQGTIEKMPSRVAFSGYYDLEIAQLLLDDDQNFILSPELLHGKISTREDLKNSDLDAVIRITSCSPVLKLNVIYDGSGDRSRATHTRLKPILQKYKLNKLQQIRSGKSSDRLDLRIIPIDLASQKAKSQYLLGILLPMIMVIITVMGGLYPAIEVVVSEKERKTLETTLLIPISGLKLVTAKFLAVVFMSMTAMLLNLASMLLTIKYTLFSQADFSNFSFRLPLAALPLIILGSFLIAATFSALMIMVSCFANSFKEAQGVVSLVYVIGIQPAVISALPGIDFNFKTALIPISNISLMFRELIRENYDWVPISITLGSLLLWCLILLFIARHLIGKEEFITGFDKKLLISKFSFGKIGKR